MEGTPQELEAVRLRFHMKHPDAPQDAKPSLEVAQELLAEVRAREQMVERQALDILFQKTRNQPSRSGMNSRYMQLLVLVLVALVVLGLVVAGIAWIFGWR